MQFRDLAPFISAVSLSSSRHNFEKNLSRTQFFDTPLANSWFSFLCLNVWLKAQAAEYLGVHCWLLTAARLHSLGLSFPSAENQGLYNYSPPISKWAYLINGFLLN